MHILMYYDYPPDMYNLYKLKSCRRFFFVFFFWFCFILGFLAVDGLWIYSIDFVLSIDFKTILAHFI